MVYQSGVAFYSSMSPLKIFKTNRIKSFVLSFAKFFPRKELSEIYIQLNIPKIKQLYKIYASLYFYDIINTDKYPQIKASTTELLFSHNYNTRKNSLIIPLNNFSNFRYTFLYNAVKVWNDIPGNIKNTESRKKFKNSIKKHFTESY